MLNICPNKSAAPSGHFVSAPLVQPKPPFSRHTVVHLPLCWDLLPCWTGNCQFAPVITLRHNPYRVRLVVKKFFSHAESTVSYKVGTWGHRQKCHWDNWLYHKFKWNDVAGKLWPLHIYTLLGYRAKEYSYRYSLDFPIHRFKRTALDHVCETSENSELENRDTTPHLCSLFPDQMPH